MSDGIGGDVHVSFFRVCVILFEHPQRGLGDMQQKFNYGH